MSNNTEPSKLEQDRDESSSSSKTADSDEYIRPTINIIYGSQTGNAEDLAKRIGLIFMKAGYEALVEAMDDFPLKTLPRQELMIFVCSTTGHGQEPENMRNLFTFLRRRDLPKACLSGLKFVVFGIGDSSYEKFNYVAKILHRRLESCGAKPILDLVLGDEQHPLGCDAEIYSAIDKLMSRLPDLKSEKFEERSSYKIDTSGLCDTPGIFREELYSKFGLKTASCIMNERITKDTHFQDTRFIKLKSLDISSYEPGDVCAVMPENDPDDVNSFLGLLNLSPEQTICVRKRNPHYMVNYLYDFIPDGLKVVDLVKHYLDIQSVPRRSFFQFLWPFSGSDLERNKLREFASIEGYEEMYEYCIQPKRSILEVLKDFPDTVRNIELEYLLDIIPPIKPRSFSIASSSNVHPNEIHLIVGVVNYKTRMRKTRKGLCSNYLAKMGSSDDLDQVLFFQRRTSFKMPSNSDIPMIMVGPGLGIAPFRAFIEERAISMEKPMKSRLYFGCRYRDADYYFKNELENLKHDSSFCLRVAFSRDQHKNYVQDLMLEDSDELKELIINQNCIVYVAGNSKLPEGVRSLLEKIMPNNNLENEERLFYDCW